MEGLTTKEVKASLRMMGAKYQVKIFEADSAYSVEADMNRFLAGIGTKIDIIEFFPVGAATALTYPPANHSASMSSPLKVEISTPGSDSTQSYCAKCGSYENDALTSSQTHSARDEKSAFTVGLLYIEYPEESSTADEAEA
jgi:hypothetical protein